MQYLARPILVCSTLCLVSLFASQFAWADDERDPDVEILISQGIQPDVDSIREFLESLICEPYNATAKRQKEVYLHRASPMLRIRDKAASFLPTF